MARGLGQWLGAGAAALAVWCFAALASAQSVRAPAAAIPPRAAVLANGGGAAVPLPVQSRVSRTTLLALHLDEIDTRASSMRWVPAIELTLGALSLGIGILVDDWPAPAAFSVSGALWMGGGLAGLLVSDGLKAPVMFATTSAGVGALALLMAAELESSRSTPWGLISVGSGALGSALLTVISTVIRVPTSAARLATDYRRLRDPAVRAAMSEAEVRAIEDRYRLFEPALTLPVIFMPMLLGNAGAGIHFLSRADTDGEVLGGAVLLGGALVSGILLALPREFALYEDQLEGLGIDLRVQPSMGGLQLGGHF